MALKYTLEAAILKSLEAIPLRITPKHIKSHQDNEETNLLKLLWEAQLNIVTTDLLHINCTLYVMINSKCVTCQICKSLFDTASYSRL